LPDGPVASYVDIDQVQLLCLHGHNVAEVQTVLWERVLAAKKKNAGRIIVADPRKTPTVRQGGDLHRLTLFFDFPYNHPMQYMACRTLSLAAYAACGPRINIATMTKRCCISVPRKLLFCGLETEFNYVAPRSTGRSG
jgi:hypothetical protein